MQIIDRHGKGGKLTRGKGCAISRGVSLDITDNITLGNGVIISEDVKFFTHDHLISDPLEIKHSPLTIGNDVYIGANSIILNNCNRIGNGAYIGAGSIVTRDIDDNAVAAGNPAKIIRHKE